MGQDCLDRQNVQEVLSNFHSIYYINMKMDKYYIVCSNFIGAIFNETIILYALPNSCHSCVRYVVEPIVSVWKESQFQ